MVAVAVPPAARISSATAAASEPVREPRSSTTTAAPSRPRSSACSRPIPPPAPVTIATRPSSRPIVVPPRVARSGGSTTAWTSRLSSPTTPTTTSRRPAPTPRSSAPRSSPWSSRTSATSAPTTAGTRTTTTTRGRWRSRGCGRAVATWRRCRTRRCATRPTPSIAQPIEAGKYISIYWITEGQYENHLRFAVGTNHRLFADGRVFMERDHTFTSFQRYLGPIYRDDDGPRDIHSLNYPYDGLVVEVIDANDSAARDQLVEWLRAERVPGVRLVGGDGHDVRPHAPARRQAALREGRRGRRRPHHDPVVHRGRLARRLGRLRRRRRAGGGDRPRPGRAHGAVHTDAPRHRPLRRRAARGE